MPAKRTAARAARSDDLKTRPTSGSVDAFLNGIADEERRRDCRKLVQILKRGTGAAPRMWGTSVVGFGTYHYVYPSGREGDWFLAGFSPRKQDLTVYVLAGLDGYASLLGKLGKFKTGKACLYLKRLSDVDEAVLEELVTASTRQIRKTYPG